MMIYEDFLCQTVYMSVTTVFQSINPDWIRDSGIAILTAELELLKYRWITIWNSRWSRASHRIPS